MPWSRRSKRADRRAAPDPPSRVAPPPVPPIADAYTSEAPSPQLAIDIFAGEWSSVFPKGYGHTGGHASLFDDDRVRWAIERLGGVDGRSVLELGPLEGGHTTMLERAGATVTAVEANSRSYLKCLVTKELMGLQRSTFLRGDFRAYLERDQPSYDVVFASGVLYHMEDPLRLLELMASASDTLVLWTHYYDAAIVSAAPFARQFTRTPTSVVRDGRTYTLHPRDYLEALSWGGFSGAGASWANWMSRDDLTGYLSHLGHSDLEVGCEQPDHPNGPALALVARRPS